MEIKHQEGVLFYNAGGFLIRGAGHYQVDGSTTDGLTSVWSGMNLWIHAGGLDANCKLTVIEHSEEPPVDVDPGWTEIVEVSVESEDEGLWLDMAGEYTPGIEGPLTSAGSGSYRVRAYATGRDRAYELIDPLSDEVSESFRLDIWSAPVAGPATLRASDQTGKRRQSETQ